MRFKASIILKGHKPFKIPTNYRRNVLSLIKESINNIPEIYEKYYSDRTQNTSKPFTYSLYIPSNKVEKINDKSFLVFDSNTLEFCFSTNDPILLMNVYNGLLNIKSDFLLFAYKIEIKYFHLEKEFKIDTDKIKFKTLSPIVIRDISDKKGSGNYLKFDDPDFKTVLFHNIKNLCQNFIDSDYKLEKEEITINFLKAEALKVYNYNEAIKASNGVFEIEAKPEILKLIYDVGLGARRSQGFGMLEVI